MLDRQVVQIVVGAGNDFLEHRHDEKALDFHMDIKIGLSIRSMGLT